DAEGQSTDALSGTAQVSMLVEAVQLALDGIKARAAGLPGPDDPGFNELVSQLLAELRRLQTTTDCRSPRGRGPSRSFLVMQRGVPTAMPVHVTRPQSRQKVQLPYAFRMSRGRAG